MAILFSLIVTVWFCYYTKTGRKLLRKTLPTEYRFKSWLWRRSKAGAKGVVGRIRAEHDAARRG